MLDRVDLGKVYTRISGTSYKEETIRYLLLIIACYITILIYFQDKLYISVLYRNMFLEALPQVGSKESALFILDLIQGNKVSDISAIQLLMRLPFYIRRPDVQLLINLQPFLTLPSKIRTEVQNTAILAYGTLIYKTCLVYCPYEMLDDYVRLYLDKFTGICNNLYLCVSVLQFISFEQDYAIRSLLQKLLDTTRKWSGWKVWRIYNWVELSSFQSLQPAAIMLNRGIFEYSQLGPLFPRHH